MDAVQFIYILVGRNGQNSLDSASVFAKDTHPGSEEALAGRDVH